MSSTDLRAALIQPRFWLSWPAAGILRLLSIVPLPLLWIVGAAIGELIAFIPSRGRRAADINLALCFPALPVAARRRLRQAMYRTLAQAGLSIGISLWGSRRRLQRLVHFRGREYYDAALAAGQHIILLAPHFIAMDIAGLRLSQERPMISMYKSFKNPVFDYILRRARSRFGGLMIERSSELRPLVRLLRKGLPFYYLPDQDPGTASFVFAPFFGIPAATITAPSRLARLANAVVIPCYTRLLPWGRGYEVIFHAPLPEFPSEDSVRDATCLNAAVEETVRALPEQYLWTYKRFKTRPENAPNHYG